MRQLTFLSGVFGIPGTSEVARIRPTVVSACGARLWEIENGKSPRTVQGPRALERGEAPFGRHLMGGDRGMKATRTRGTTRAAAPFHHRDHAVGRAFGYADAGLGLKGVGVT